MQKKCFTNEMNNEKEGKETPMPKVPILYRIILILNKVIFVINKK